MSRVIRVDPEVYARQELKRLQDRNWSDVIRERLRVQEDARGWLPTIDAREARQFFWPR